MKTKPRTTATDRKMTQVLNQLDRQLSEALNRARMIQSDRDDIWKRNQELNAEVDTLRWLVRNLSAQIRKLQHDEYYR